MEDCHADFNNYNYHSFLSKIGQLERAASPDLLLKRIDCLVEVGFINTAYEFSADLLSQRGLPHLIIQKTTLFSQYLEWLNNDQNAYDGFGLVEKMHDLIRGDHLDVSIQVLARKIALSIKSNLVILGYVDIGNIESIVLDYQQLIDDCVHTGYGREAYQCIIELVSFVRERPCPDVKHAEQFLQQYLELSMISGHLYRKGMLHLIIGEIRFDTYLMLHKHGDESFQDCYELATACFLKNHCDLGLAEIKRSRGLVLLRHGDQAGYELLVEAIKERNHIFSTNDRIRYYVRLDKRPIRLRNNQIAGRFLFRPKEILTSRLQLITQKDQLVHGQYVSYEEDLIYYQQIDDHLEKMAVLEIIVAKMMGYGAFQMASDLLKAYAGTMREKGDTIHLAHYYRMVYETEEPINWDFAKKLFDVSFTLYLYLRYDEYAGELLIIHIRHLIKRCYPTPSKSLLNEIFSRFQKGYELLSLGESVEVRELFWKLRILDASFRLEAEKPFVALKVLSESNIVDATYPISREVLALYDLCMGRILIRCGEQASEKEYYSEAQKALDSALEYFEKKTMTDMVWVLFFEKAWLFHSQVLKLNDRYPETINQAIYYYKQAIEARNDALCLNQRADQHFMKRLSFVEDFHQKNYLLFCSSINFFFIETLDLYNTLWCLEQNKARTLLQYLGTHTASKSTMAEVPSIQTIIDIVKNSDKYLDSNHDQLFVQFYFDANKVLIIGYHTNWNSPQYKYLDMQAWHHFLMAVHYIFHGHYVGEHYDGIEQGEQEEWLCFKEILSFIAEWSEPGDIICFIPSSELIGVPFHTLKVGAEYLIERNPVYYAPSSSVLALLLEKRRDFDFSDRIAVFGDATGDLPWAKNEAETLGEMWHIQPVIGMQVTKSALLQALGHSMVVHLSVHGKFNGQGADNRLFLADEETISAIEIFEQSWDNDLVVLNGCETGMQESNIGDEMVGLVSAFLHAGSTSIISSLWRVNDQSAQLLFESFYANLRAGQSKVVALQQAMKALIRTTDRCHWYHWGAFTITGSGN